MTSAEKDCDDILNLCCSKGEIGFVKQLMDEYHCVPSSKFMKCIIMSLINCCGFVESPDIMQ